jgi:site-specific recombinase XerD
LARSTILPKFVLYEMSEIEDNKSECVNLKNVDIGQGKGKYYRTPVDLSSKSYNSGNDYSYNFFPIILTDTGEPWKEATIYLLKRMENSNKANIVSYHSIASDLANFKSFTEQECIDPFIFPKQKLRRPTYRYRAKLIQDSQAGLLSIGTAKRRISTVISFYKWTETELHLKFEYPPWQDKKVMLTFNDRYGAARIKLTNSTDLTISGSKVDSIFDESIIDSGKLRPLSHLEQKGLLTALEKLGSIEFSLIHHIALFTGARIQTILTLRVASIKTAKSSNRSFYIIKCGPGTLIDTKYNKSFNIYLPYWLMERLKVYSQSERASIRRKRSTIANEHSYLFLTNRGQPYYTSKSEISKFDGNNLRRRPHNGEGVRQFIGNRVISLTREILNDPDFKYQFHDLRASFGMNITEMKLMDVQNNICTFSEARDFIKKLMCHESYATSEIYLNYSQKLESARNIQLNYETHLSDLIRIASRAIAQ